MIDREGILEILPHRPPMLMVDGVGELDPEQRAVGFKVVTEQDCAGHFPGHPVMPGVHIAEALAQVAAIIVFHESLQQVIVAQVVLMAGLLATLIPAWRAVRMDPVEALAGGNAE